MTTWCAALASRSNAEFPRIGSSEESQPFIDAAVAGECEATAAVALDDQFVEVFALLCAQTAQ
jgi:hypothetical protein